MPEAAKVVFLMVKTASLSFLQMVMKYTVTVVSNILHISGGTHLSIQIYGGLADIIMVNLIFVMVIMTVLLRHGSNL